MCVFETRVKQKLSPVVLQVQFTNGSLQYESIVISHDSRYIGVLKQHEQDENTLARTDIQQFLNKRLLLEVSADSALLASCLRYTCIPSWNTKKPTLQPQRMYVSSKCILINLNSLYQCERAQNLYSCTITCQNENTAFWLLLCTHVFYLGYT